MKLEITLDEAIDPSIRQLVERQAGFALSRFDSIIDSLSVSVRDENGPRGGDDIRCRIRIVIPRLPEIVVREQADTAEKAVTVAFERISNSVARQVRRRQRNLEYQRRRVAD